MKIYLMARYQRHPEMQGVATRLEALGHTVTSRWIWGKHDVQDVLVGTGHLGTLEAQFAREDIEDLQRADCGIAFSEPPRSPSRGGRHVEFGMALAGGLRCIVVGGAEHVFHALPTVEHVPDVLALYAMLTAERA